MSSLRRVALSRSGRTIVAGLVTGLSLSDGRSEHRDREAFRAARPLRACRRLVHVLVHRLGAGAAQRDPGRPPADGGHGHRSPARPGVGVPGPGVGRGSCPSTSRRRCCASPAVALHPRCGRPRADHPTGSSSTASPRQTCLPADPGPVPRIAAGHCPASPVQVDAQTRVVRPRPRQIFSSVGGSPSIRRSGPAGAPVPLAHSGRRRRSWQPTPAPPRVRARRRPRTRRGPPWSPGTGRR